MALVVLAVVTVALLALFLFFGVGSGKTGP
jgi:hypothetical protein